MKLEKNKGINLGFIIYNGFLNGNVMAVGYYHHNDDLDVYFNDVDKEVGYENYNKGKYYYV